VNYREVVSLSVEASRPLIEARQHRLGVEFPGRRSRCWQTGGGWSGYCKTADPCSECTDTGGEIRIVVRSEGNSVVTDIIDNGRGVAPETLERIFDLFTRAAASTTPDRKRPGHGLALARSW